MSYLSTLAAESGMLPDREPASIVPAPSPAVPSGFEETIQFVPGVSSGPPADSQQPSPPRIVLNTNPDPALPPLESAPQYGDASAAAEVHIDIDLPVTDPRAETPPPVSATPLLTGEDTGPPNQSPADAPSPFTPPPPRLSFDAVRAWVSAGPRPTEASPPEDDLMVQDSRFESVPTDPQTTPAPVVLELGAARQDVPVVPITAAPEADAPPVPEQQVTVSIGTIELVIDAPPGPIAPVWRPQPVASSKPLAADAAQRLRRRYVNLGEPY